MTYKQLASTIRHNYLKLYGEKCRLKDRTLVKLFSIWGENISDRYLYGSIELTQRRHDWRRIWNY